MTPAIIDKICQLLAMGNYRLVSAKVAGIGQSTLEKWIGQGKLKPNSKYGEFRRRILEAEAMAEVRHVGTIAKASSNGDPKAAQWWLTHKQPERWAKTEVAQTKAISSNAPLIAFVGSLIKDTEPDK